MHARAQGRSIGPRSATNPPRGLTPDGVAALDREELRLLVTALLAELGLDITDVTPRGDHDELVLRVRTAWRRREGRARIAYAPVSQRDMEEFAQLAEQGALGEAILVATRGLDGDATQPPQSLQLIDVDELIERFEESAVVEWDGEIPAHDRVALARLRAIDSAQPWLDVLGLRALPLLARNKQPPELDEASAPPDELFERLTFRLLTALFRFGGTDLGARARGQRKPDALLESPNHSPVPFSVVLDCKASRDGFLMDADDETRLCNYVETHTDDLEVPEQTFLVVVSSAFLGGSAVFNSRRLNVRGRCGAHLVYWHVEHLVLSAQRLEEQRIDPADRESLPWREYFATGMPATDIWSFSQGEEA